MRRSSSRGLTADMDQDDLLCIMSWHNAAYVLMLHEMPHDTVHHLDFLCIMGTGGIA